MVSRICWIPCKQSKNRGHPASYGGRRGCSKGPSAHCCRTQYFHYSWSCIFPCQCSNKRMCREALASGLGSWIFVGSSPAKAKVGGCSSFFLFCNNFIKLLGGGKLAWISAVTPLLRELLVVTSFMVFYVCFSWKLMRGKKICSSGQLWWFLLSN